MPNIIDSILLAVVRSGNTNDGLSPLHRAAMLGNLEEINSLLSEEDVFVDQKAHERTPLYMATLAGQEKVFARLLEVGASVTPTAANYRRSPLHVVAEFNCGSNMVDQLLAAGAIVNAVNSEGKTPLHVAAMRGNDSEFPQLLAAGAEVNVANGDGFTGIDVAAFDSSCNNVVKTLIQHGANINPHIGNGIWSVNDIMLELAESKDVADAKKEAASNDPNNDDDDDEIAEALEAAAREYQIATATLEENSAAAAESCA